MYDVVTMGSATQDVFAMTDAETVTFRHGHDEQELIAYPLGSKILIHDIDFQIGGGGTNTATTFARQGLKTGFIGKIGKDPSGYAVMKFLKEEGITFLGAVGHHTGYSIILDSEEDDRTILTFKGCNDDLSLEELDTMLMELETRWLYCSSMLGKSYKTMRHVMKLLKGRGANVAFNPSCYQAEQGLEALRDVLAHVDIIILNADELSLLTGKSGEEGVSHLKAAGPRTVLVTNGKHGVTLYGDVCVHAPPAPQLTVVETTGAGDAFGSGFVAALARNYDEQHALIAGMLNAEHVIAEYGAKHHILTKEELDELLKSDARDCEVKR